MKGSILNLNLNNAMNATELYYAIQLNAMTFHLSVQYMKRTAEGTASTPANPQYNENLFQFNV